MLKMKPHESEVSRKTWDIVDDVFDLGLVMFAGIWAVTGMHFDEDVLKTVALTGASVRIASRRVFRAILGPRINAWVIRQQIIVTPPAQAEPEQAPSSPEEPEKE